MFKIRFVIGIICLLMLISASHAIADTEISGAVSGVWTPEGSPYRIIGETVIPVDETLEIQPGVTVFWDRDCYLYLNGTLIAIGAEDDSIRFTGHDHYNFIRNDLEEGGANLTARYVQSDFINYFKGRFDDVEISNTTLRAFWIDSYGSVVIIHNNFEFEYYAGDNSLEYISGEPDTLVYRDNTMIFSYLVFQGLRDIVLENNDFGFNSSLLLRSCQAIDVTNNLGLGLAIGSSSDVQCFNNTLSYVLLEASNILLSDNKIRGNCELGSTRNALVEGNDVDGALAVNRCIGIMFKNNVFRSEARISSISDNSVDIELVNNVFLNHNKNFNPMYSPFSGFEFATLRNNIFMSPQPAEHAFDSNYQQDSDYNCFFGFDEIFADSSDIAEHDIIADPRMVGGNPYEVDLRFDSPCIDAGDPDFDPDPDGSPADIGAIFFDHDVNHPPSITSQWTNYAGTGQPFSYTAEAVEEDNQFDFSFVNLPDWLNPVDQNLNEGWVELAGEMPVNQQDFVFEIHVSDEAENEDTLSVFIDCIDATLLSGTLSGTLTSEDSPYAIVDDILVEEGEQLIIEDGVDLVVYPKLHCINEDWTGIDVFGQLQILGLPQSKVNFSRNVGELPGTPIYCNTEDSILFHYVDAGVLGVTRAGLLEIVGCKIEQILGFSRIDRVIIRDCEMEGINLDADSIFFFDNVVKDGPTTFRVFDSQYLYMENNQIYKCGHDDFHNYGTSTFRLICEDIIFCRNLIYNNYSSIEFRSEGSTLIESNTVTNLYNGVALRFYQLEPDEMFILNNVFSNTHHGIALPENGANITVANNLFDTRGSGIINPTDDMGVVDRVNQNGDSTDAFGNMFLPAEVIDFGPRPFAPLASSPAVDAGSDDLPDDPDWTPPDIGYWCFDHENRAPRIFDAWPHENGNILDTIMVQVEPNLRQDFHVGVEDYGDVPQGRWILNNVVISNKPCIYGNRGYYDCRDTIQFMDNGIYNVKFQTTDGYNITEVIWQVSVGNVSVNSEVKPPQEFTVLPAFPNPFNSMTTIGYSLPAVSDVRVAVYDLSGREVARLADGAQTAGTHEAVWQADGVASGVYVVKLDASGVVAREKVVLVK